jgi:hypothetical protein
LDRGGTAVLMLDKEQFKQSFKRMLNNENMLKKHTESDENFKTNYLKMMSILEKNFTKEEIKSFMEELDNVRY